MTSLEQRQKRAKIRSWRRGMKEVDLLLGPFADQVSMEAPQMDLFEALLDEVDQDIYGWFTGAISVPEQHSLIVGEVRKFHKM